MSFSQAFKIVAKSLHGMLWLLASMLLLPFASDASNPAHPGLIGLLEIPYTWDEPSRGNKLAIPARLFSVANKESPGMGAMKVLSHVETHEWSYEELAAAVYEYHYDGELTWYRLRIASSGKPAWIAASKGMIFHPLSALVSESLSYLTSAWDKRLFSRASEPSTAAALKVTGDEIPIAVAETAILKGKLWILVVVLKESVCSSADAPAVLASGWIPAHARTGKMNIWFYSRGC